jgi:hypothetical protein
MQSFATNLPDLAWQWAYARLGWGIVCAALVLWLWPRAAGVAPAATTDTAAGARVEAAPTPRAAGVIAALAALAMWLPHAASPAYWLGLVFQHPSAMLVAWCALALLARCTRLRTGPPLGPTPALVFAVGGLLLYADSSGWLALGLYLRGSDPLWAPLAALLAGAWAAWAVRKEATRYTALMLLAATTVFCVTRLPSGNVFDGFLDPLFWLLCVGIVLKSGVQRWRGGLRERASSK